MTNMINVYNQIVGEDDSDCTKFKEILDKHFEKYRYFCSLLEDIGEEAVAEYECVKQSHASITIRVLTHILVELSFCYPILFYHNYDNNITVG